MLKAHRPLPRSARIQQAVDDLVAIVMEQREAETGDRGDRLLGEVLAEAREGWGYSLSELARLAGLSKAHVWELEAGRALNPSVATLEALARHLRLPAANLFNAALESRRRLLDEPGDDAP